jgi:roadblock/LC7 domain-containing protein
MLSPVAVAVLLLSLGQSSPAQPAPPIDWARAEAGTLRNHVQLTFPDRFLKAGEAYFSGDGKRVVFQAIEKPADGATPDEFYAMFVADLVTSGEKITGLSNVRRVSPKGSANTCGWFDPSDSLTLYFASTVGPPTAEGPAGYQRGTGRYRWPFPPEMRIVMVDLKKADGSAASLMPVVGDGKGYVAEGSISPDGRYLIYCDKSKNEGDIYVMDRETNEKIPLVTARGYDGGPFFAPDGKRIVYRSDRNNDDLLQVFVADLKFDAKNNITGISEEHQVTHDKHVNWCPFFHPNGKFLVFASSAVGHDNYEIFAVDAGSWMRDGVPVSRYGTNLRRVTQASGADVLPVFSHDGRWMMWTGQRGDDVGSAHRSSQLFAAEWIMPDEPPPEAAAK